MSSKSIEPNIPSTETNHLPRLDNPNEEIQLDFIGPITIDNRPFHILLSNWTDSVNGQWQAFARLPIFRTIHSVKWNTKNHMNR